jgi:hypothetical protein
VPAYSQRSSMPREGLARSKVRNRVWPRGEIRGITGEVPGLSAMRRVIRLIPSTDVVIGLLSSHRGLKD